MRRPARAAGTSRDDHRAAAEALEDEPGLGQHFGVARQALGSRGLEIDHLRHQQGLAVDAGGRHARP